MIEVDGYKAFHGDILVQFNGQEPFRIFNKDFLYNPDIDCWCCDLGGYYVSSVIGIFEYCSPEQKHCGDNIIVSEEGDELDPCVYDVIETHENVTVEVLKCCNCGHIELSWHNEGEFDENKY